MHESDDMTLLREYAARGSEAAFAELVSRRVSFVYSAALRQVSDSHRAQEITQAVFVILAQKAGRISDKTNLTGWLFKTTRFVALAQQRAANARRQREQEFHMQTDTLNAPNDPLWELISPRLDEALMRLGEKDRQTVLLHYFDKKSFAEIGMSLGMSDVTARKRASRALEKLRKILSKLGVTSTAAILAGAMMANSTQAAPATLAKSVTAIAFTKGAVASASTLTLIQGALKLMAWSKTKTTIVVGIGVLIAAGITTVGMEKSHARKIEKMWRMNKDVPTAKIDQLPPLFKIVPTKFSPPWINGNCGSNNDKFVGARVHIHSIAAYAYEFPEDRIRFATPEPTNRFDYVATLPHGNREALQQALKTRFGFVGHVETETKDVLLLKVNHANAPGWKPAIPGKADAYYKPGIYHSSNEAMDTGAPRFEGFVHFLAGYFDIPVIDQTGITQRYAMDLRWREQRGNWNPDDLKQDMLNKLGLELVPAKMPVEILVMDKVR